MKGPVREIIPLSEQQVRFPGQRERQFRRNVNAHSGPS
jgi:hypothetical protein